VWALNRTNLYFPGGGVVAPNLPLPQDREVAVLTDEIVEETLSSSGAWIIRPFHCSDP
jgi:hypothetical protein